MSIIIKLTFPGGQYHATPWGRHVNEGVPEWPPSPWRLLRAIIAVWKRTCPAIPEEQIKRIIARLMAPPSFALPPYRVAHTRHAMPMNVLARSYKPSQAERKAGKFQGDPSIVFDTFVSVARAEPLFIGWKQADLSPADSTTLTTLLANLSSLGRAESWVNAELSEEPTSWNCIPAPDMEPNPVPVFCADPTSALAGEHYPTVDLKKLAKGTLKPSDLLFDCPRWHICLDTETIHAARWPSVPGAKWVNYTRPLVAPASAAQAPTDGRRPSVARFLLDGPVLPLITESLHLAETFRRGLLSRFQRSCHRRRYGRATTPFKELFRSRVLSGKHVDGQFLRDDHCHAFYLCTAEGGDPRWITHLTVTALDGFGPDEVAAMNEIRRLRLDDNANECRVQLIAIGQQNEFRNPLLQESATWVSATPFVVTRHAKRRGRKRDAPETLASSAAFAEVVLREELERLAERRGALPAVTSIEPLMEGEAFRIAPADWRRDAGAVSFRLLQFKRFRRKHGDDGGRRPSGAFKITFAEPVRGPICLGYSCHFGMGLFLPTADEGPHTKASPGAPG